MRQPTAQEKALRHVQSLMASAKAGARLPTIVQLAAGAEVSPGAMWRVVNRLAREGVLQARPRSGIRLSPEQTLPAAAGADEASAPRGRKWQRVRAAIESDLLRGRFPAGELIPPVKQLRGLYGACYATVRKALDSLVAGRLLSPAPGGYRPHALGARRSPGTVVFVPWSAGDVVLSLFEREAAQAGVRLRILPLFPWRELLDTLSSLRRDRDAVVGVALAITGGHPFQYREILRRVLPLGRPVAVLDRSGGATGTGLPVGRLLRVFTTAKFETPGRHVGRFLMELGHRHVAYICPLHGEDWSVRRLAGLRQVYGAAGMASAVTAFTAHPTPRAQARREAIAAEIQNLSRTLVQARRLSRRLIAGALPRLSSALAFEAEWEWIAQVQRPLMQQALARPEITAWAAGNDRAALIALAFLKERRVRVPCDISVVGFDDLPQAYAAGLTSYNFNEAAAVRAVFSHVLGVGPRVRGVPAHEPVEIEGFMSVRATSGPAR